MADLLIDRVKEVLQENNISVYHMEDTCTEGAELYFIRKHMDMRRMKKVRHTTVTVYRDFEKDGTKRRGYADVSVAEYMSKEELSQKIKDAYFAASFIIFPAIATRPSTVVGIPSSSNVRATTTPPYFLTNGKIASMLSCFPLTELISALPL